MRLHVAIRDAQRRVLFTEDTAGIEDEHEHRVLGFDGALMSYVLILLVFAACVAEKYKLPASTAAIVIGAIFGAVFRAVGAYETEKPSSNSLITFDEELFLYVLLPPIIFEAGFTLNTRYFFGNLATIVLFAVVGTLASTFVIGQTLYMIGYSGAFKSGSRRADALDFSTPLDSYLFGALISATDPVATLSIMGAVNADPVVYNLIFGESVLNDAVAIVLVRIIEDMGKTGFSEPSAYVNGVLQFFAVSLGSLGVGVLVSAVSAVLLKRVDLSHHPSFELSYILLVGYTSYATAEAVEGSGILALFTTGVLAGKYHASTLSPVARDSCGVTLKALAHLAETAVFAYMGVDLFAITGAGVDAFTQASDAFAKARNALFGNTSATSADAVAAAGGIGDDDRPYVVSFVLVALLVVLCARVIVMLPLCRVASCMRGRRRALSARATAMLVFAGLRGAIAFALAHNVRSEHQASIAAATTTVVMVTVFVLGGATRTVLRLLRMEAPPATERGDPSMLEHGATRSDDYGGPVERGNGAAASSGASGGDTETLNDGGRFGRLFIQFDERYLMPLFGAGGRGAATQPPSRAELIGAVNCGGGGGGAVPESPGGRGLELRAVSREAFCQGTPAGDTSSTRQAV